MKFHFCTESPCPLMDKEIYDRLENGFTALYAIDSNLNIGLNKKGEVIVKKK